MKKSLIFLACLLIASFVIAQDATGRLNYADFEQVSKEKTLISTREGKVSFNVASQNPANRPKIVPKMLGPQVPLTQRIGFEFEITKPNDYASAYVKIIGMKDKGHLDDWAKTLIVKADDVSTYKYLTLDIGAAGVTQVRIDLISEGNGIDAGGANQEKVLDIDSQLKTYRLPISEFKQPTGDWVKKKYTVEQVIKKLTAVQINVTQVPSKGFVVVDNIAFEK